jgi:metal-responsive CopG/Arc/MetJ family transcriptional regulator
MKAIQITIGTDLLAQFDADDQVQRLGRSAVLRQVAAEYIARRKRQVVAEQYQRAYAGAAGDPLPELEAWEGEGVWPSE